MSHLPLRENRKLRQILLTFIGLALSFLVSGIMLIFFNINPVKTYGSIFSRAFGSVNGITQTVNSAIPMIIIAAGIDFARRAGIFNIGAEGQMMLGAVGAQLAAMQTQRLCAPVAILVTLLGGALFGTLWALLPALFKTLIGVNEIVVLIMMNQIASFLLGYLVRAPLKDPGDSNNQAVMIPENAQLPVIIPGIKIHMGFVIAILLVVALWLVMRITSYGFRMSVVGLSPRASAYAGISAPKVVFITFLIAGGISGLAGANQVTGLQYRLTGTITNNYGFVGLTIAMISGSNPIMILIVSILYSALQVGGLVIQITQRVPMELANIIQAVTVLFVMCADNIYSLYIAQKDRKYKILALSKKEA